MCKNQHFRKIQVASIFSVNWRAWRGASQVKGGLGNLVRSSEDLDSWWRWVATGVMKEMGCAQEGIRKE